MKGSISAALFFLLMSGMVGGGAASSLSPMCVTPYKDLLIKYQRLAHDSLSAQGKASTEISGVFEVCGEEAGARVTKICAEAGNPFCIWRYNAMQFNRHCYKAELDKECNLTPETYFKAGNNRRDSFTGSELCKAIKRSITDLWSSENVESALQMAASLDIKCDMTELYASCVIDGLTPSCIPMFQANIWKKYCTENPDNTDCLSVYR